MFPYDEKCPYLGRLAKACTTQGMRNQRSKLGTVTVFAEFFGRWLAANGVAGAIYIGYRRPRALSNRYIEANERSPSGLVQRSRWSIVSIFRRSRFVGLSLKSTQFSNRARPSLRPSLRSDSPHQKRAASPPSITNSLPVSGFMSNPPTGPNFVRCPSPEGDILARGAPGEAPIWTAVVALMAGTSPQYALKRSRKRDLN